MKGFRVTVSAAVSRDGYMDDRSPRRLVLSSPQDWEQVYRLRAASDAILVGAGTLRSDNPSLTSKGTGGDPLRVAISRKGDLDPSAKFFTGPGRALVFVEKGGGAQLRDVADVVELNKVTPRDIIKELKSRGISTLLVEGGARTIEMFFHAGAVDEVRLAVAPVRVGDPAAPLMPQTTRFVVESTERLGDTTVHHMLTPDEYYLRMAIEQGRNCTPSDSAYSVGAVVLTAENECFTGYTGETAPHDHAEEAAVTKALAAGVELAGASMYSSMEPCSTRKSKPESCSAMMIRRRFARSVFAMFEPDCFVECRGADDMRSSGMEVLALTELSGKVKTVNKHIIK